LGFWTRGGDFGSIFPATNHDEPRRTMTNHDEPKSGGVHDEPYELPACPCVPSNHDHSHAIKRRASARLALKKGQFLHSVGPLLQRAMSQVL
jgi:hypothetical protein